MNADPSDHTLMLRYQAGDAAAFDLLYARHRGGLYRYFLRQVKTREIAEELYQDVWTKLIAARLSWQPSAQFNTWLYTLAHNRLIDHYRRDARARAVEFESDDIEQLHAPASRVDEPSVQAQSREAAAALQSALATLPAPQREAFLLSLEGGLGVAEIASSAGIGFEAAKSRLRYALNKMRLALKAYA